MDPTEATGDGDLPSRRRRKRSWGGGLARAGGGGSASTDGLIFSSDAQTQVSWNSVGISQANGQSLENGMDEGSADASVDASSISVVKNNNKDGVSSIEDSLMLDIPSSSSRHRLYEPLGPIVTARRAFADELPPPDFDETLSYPKGWLAGKKRKRVNVDVVESMRRIAIQEMRRQDREIKELNEQLEEDARCMEILQEQLQEERKKRLDAERSNATLESQVVILTDMLNEVEDGGGEGGLNDQEH